MGHALPIIWYGLPEPEEGAWATFLDDWHTERYEELQQIKRAYGVTLDWHGHYNLRRAHLRVIGSTQQGVPWEAQSFDPAICTVDPAWEGQLQAVAKLLDIPLGDRSFGWHMAAIYE